MNNLEERLFNEFDRYEKFSQYISKVDATRIVSRVVLEVAEKSYRRGTADQFMGLVSTSEQDYFEDFKRELLGE